jgi:hypothetical protein
VTSQQRSRILRECAVDLIRASDLSDDLAYARVLGVARDLAAIQAGLRLSGSWAGAGRVAA